MTELGAWNLELNKTIKKIVKKLGPKIRHTIRRQLDYNILSLPDELRLAESKIISKWNRKELPEGIMDIIQERTDARLRNRNFIIMRKWKKDSIATRLGNRASKEIRVIEVFKDTKSLTKGLKEQVMNNLKQQRCTTRNCFICRHDPPNPAA